MGLKEEILNHHSFQLYFKVSCEKGREKPCETEIK
jgi:hypothetical protein